MHVASMLSWSRTNTLTNRVLWIREILTTPRHGAREVDRTRCNTHRHSSALTGTHRHSPDAAKVVTAMVVVCRNWHSVGIVSYRPTPTHGARESGPRRCLAPVNSARDSLVVAALSLRVSHRPSSPAFEPNASTSRRGDRVQAIQPLWQYPNRIFHYGVKYPI